LELREDRQTPRHASYVLRFTNSEGRTNRDPVKYPIAVDTDLSPEASILLPQEKAIDVRLNDTITVEAEARDPDFALADVRLHSEVAGRPVIAVPLLNGKHTGRFTGRYQFTPSAHNLRAGDVIQYWVVASDNRTPSANTAESERKLMRIVSPDPAGQPPPDRIARNDRRQQPNPQRENQQQPGERQEQGGHQQGGEQNQGNGQSRDREPSSPDGQQQRNDEQLSRDAQQSEEPGNSNASQPGDEKSGQQNKETGSQGDGQQRDGESTSVGGDQQRRNGKQQPNNEKQTGTGAAGGESSRPGSQPAGTRPHENTAAQQSDGEPRNGNQQQPAAEKAPVSSGGDHDAEAFERIQRHMERTGELKDGDPQSPSNSEQPKRNAEPSAKQNQRQGDQETGRPGEEERPAPAGDQDSSSAHDQTRDGQPLNRDAQRGADQRPENVEEPGAETKQQDDAADQDPQPRDSGEQSASPGGQQTNSKGPSGAGQEQQSQGAPNAQPEMKPGEKRQQSGSQEREQSDQQEPPAGARGNKESDSQGEQGGDKSGGGEEGGGQKAPRDGTGSAGQNQSADEGGGESAERGDGNTSPNAGEDTTADRPSAQPEGQTKGQGSRQRAGEGEKPGGAEQSPGDKATPGQAKGQDGEPTSAGREHGTQQQEPLDKQSRPETEPGAKSGRNQSEQGDPSQRGGVPTGEGGLTGTSESPPSDGVVPEGDPANLEYARKQTDLVLDKLTDQLKRKQIDKNLLEQLGWTEDDLQRFVARWQVRKAAAQRNDPAGEAARRDLDEALRSLGLRRSSLKQSASQDDRQRDLRQGYRGPVPLEFQEQLRAYNQGVSRARQDGQ
jgi:hypothetical protein